MLISTINTWYRRDYNVQTIIVVVVELSIRLGCIRTKFNRTLEVNVMSKHSNCGCHTEGKNSCESTCGCGCNSGAPKSAVNNQWASPASVKSTITDKCKCDKNEKTATNNQWC
mgnify:CR=1 FL=1